MIKEYTVLMLKALEKTRVNAFAFIGLFIVCKPSVLRETLNHEYIHIKQQRELLIVFVGVINILEFLIKLPFNEFRINRTREALCLEREARYNQKNQLYTIYRDRYSFKDYFFPLKEKV